MINTPSEWAMYTIGLIIVFGVILFMLCTQGNRRMRRLLRELHQLIDRKQGEARMSPSYWLSGHVQYEISRRYSPEDGSVDEVKATAAVGVTIGLYCILYKRGKVRYTIGKGLQHDATLDQVSWLLSQLRKAQPGRVRV